jgi:hypothetical protein
MTFDESWLYFRIDYGQVGLQPGEEVPEKERPTIRSGKMMLTIAWNPTGFHLVNVLSKECKFNATHFITEMSSLLAEWPRNNAGASN